MSAVSRIPFEQAFLSIPVGKNKIQESNYEVSGAFPVIDQGQSLISGYTSRNDLVIGDGPYIVFGDHTRAIKFVDFLFVAGADGLRLFRAKNGFDPEFLFLFLRSVRLPVDGYGRHSKYLKDLTVPEIGVGDQAQVVRSLQERLAQVEAAREATRLQLREISSLAGAIVLDTIRNSPTKPYLLGDVLDEVKHGIGASWADHPVLGATREGLAPAKEQPGKMATKYKPVTPGTVFYNPMRILIGSIAFVDDDDAPGITSPDYVALRGKPGLVDSRWFYYWLRSHLGAQCILSLARGAVRERMLFNRLAEGKIDLPSPDVQEKASRALHELKPLQRALKSKLAEIDLLPQKILAQAFEM